jgi:hypothetical protein
VYEQSNAFFEYFLSLKNQAEEALTGEIAKNHGPNSNHKKKVATRGRQIKCKAS